MTRIEWSLFSVVHEDRERQSENRESARPIDQQAGGSSQSRGVVQPHGQDIGEVVRDSITSNYMGEVVRERLMGSRITCSSRTLVNMLTEVVSMWI